MRKDFDYWNERKKKLNRESFSEYVHEREVWWAALGVNVGFEEDGKNALFERPIIVLKKFNREVILTVPLTSKTKVGPYYVPVAHRGEVYAAIISQIRLLSTKRLLRRMYTMDERLFEKVRQAVRGML